MTDTNTDNTNAAPAPVPTSVAASVATEGKRARRGLTPKDLLPSPGWINKNVVAKDPGFKIAVGRMYGIATGFEHKLNEFQGKQLASIVVTGAFTGESYVTGEIVEASQVYFPMVYAEKIAAVFASSARSVPGPNGTKRVEYDIQAIEVDCDIGLEATGKSIPYEWVVIAYLEGEEMEALKRIRTSRRRPGAGALLPAPGLDMLEGKGLEAAQLALAPPEPERDDMQHAGEDDNGDVIEGTASETGGDQGDEPTAPAPKGKGK